MVAMMYQDMYSEDSEWPAEPYTTESEVERLRRENAAYRARNAWLSELLRKSRDFWFSELMSENRRLTAANKTLRQQAAQSDADLGKLQAASLKRFSQRVESEAEFKLDELILAASPMIELALHERGLDPNSIDLGAIFEAARRGASAPKTPSLMLAKQTKPETAQKFEAAKPVYRNGIDERGLRANYSNNMPTSDLSEVAPGRIRVIAQGEVGSYDDCNQRTAADQARAESNQRIVEAMCASSSEYVKQTVGKLDMNRKRENRKHGE